MANQQVSIRLTPDVHERLARAGRTLDASAPKGAAPIGKLGAARLALLHGLASIEARKGRKRGAEAVKEAAAALAGEHDAHTLAAAFLARLSADGRADLARTLALTISVDVGVNVEIGADGAIIITGPGNPHAPATEAR